MDLLNLGIDLFGRVIDNLKNIGKAITFDNAKTSSLLDVTQVARVEPIVIIDSDVVYVEFLPHVIQATQSIFAGTYLQAVSLLGAEVGGVKLVKKLAPFNPNSGDITWSRVYESREVNYKLPKYDKISLENIQNQLNSIVSANNTLTSQNIKLNQIVAQQDKTIKTAGINHAKQISALQSNQNTQSNTDKKKTESDYRFGVDDKSISSLKDSVNLSTGGMYNVIITKDGQSATVPINIRLITTVMQNQPMIELLTFRNKFDTNLIERWHGWNSGRLRLVSDLILCKDLIDVHRKALLKDNTEVYRKILSRENRAKINGVLNKNPSVAIASNIAIISSDSAAKIELTNGKLSKFSNRNEIFWNTNLMILIVIDKQWERVTFFYRGIEEYSTLSAKDIKQHNKNGDNNVLEVMKAFMAGGRPSI